MSLPKTRSLVAAVLLSLAGLSLTALPAHAQSPAKSPAKSAQATAAIALPAGVTLGPSAEGVTEYRFANGFKLLMLPDDSQPTVTTNLVYLVGSRHENYGETGMAHLLEHMLFKGTPGHPAIPQGFSQRGMSFNAVTSLDTTAYQESFQASDDNLRWAIAMEADRMLHSNIAKKDLDSEMTVVRNEFEERENTPFLVMLKRMQSVAYDWHSYGRSTIGNRSDIENVKIENLQAFYRTYYQPDNAVLVIAGQFDAAKALRWVNQSFGKMPKPKRKLPVFWTVEPTQDGDRQFSIRRQGDTQMVTVAYKVPPALHPDSLALGVAGAILTETSGGRLYKSLVESGLATEVFQLPLTGVAPGLQMITAIVNADADIEPVKQALIAGIESFGATPPTEAELGRIKLAQANTTEKVQSNPALLAVALTDAINLGDWRQLFAERDALDGVSAQQVAAAAAKYYRRDNRTVGVFMPEERPQRADIPVAPPMSAVLAHYQPRAAIGAGEAFDPSPGNIDKRTQLLPANALPSGLKVALLPKKTRGGMVTVSIDLNYGDEKTLFGKKAIAMMLTSMFPRGTVSKNRQQLTDASNALKVSGSVFLFQTTRDNLVPALGLAAEILRQPRFDPVEFEQLRKEMLVALESGRNDPQERGSEALSRHFSPYPAGDWRAAMSVEEKMAAVKSVTLEQVKQFYRDFYSASNGQLAIVGDFDPDEAIKAISAGFGDWRSTAPYARISQKWTDVPAQREVIDTPDKENGIYLARQNIRMRDTDADYPAMLVANYLIGSASLKSRLADRIRQQDGLSYTVGSSMFAGDIGDVGVFSVEAISAPQNLERVAKAVNEELARLVKDGFTAEELARAQSGILQEREQYRTQDMAVASDWTGLLEMGRSYAWVGEVDRKIAALTLDQLNAAVRKHLDPARLSVVMARDAAKAKAVAATGK